MSNTDPDRAHEIKLIQIGRSALQLDDATYRLMLANLAGGKTSSKALTATERQAVLLHMKARGFVVKPKANRLDGWQHEPRLRKLRAMWYVLADAGHVDRPADMEACNAAIEQWALRMFGPDHPKPGHVGIISALRFANSHQMDRLVEAMKAWLRRLKLDNGAA